MLEAIKHGLGNLLNFHGRDARQAFWYYVLFVYLVTIAITMLVTIPMMAQAFMAAVRETIAAGQSSDPQAVQMQAQAAMMRSMSGMMSSVTTVSMVVNLAMLALLAAGFVRRLHDSDLSGLWAVIPGAMQLANVAIAPGLMQQMMASMTQTMNHPGDGTAGIQAMQGSIGLASMLGWGALLIIVVLGVRKSTRGPNRFGEAAFTA
jgi:uncharacterized membrane protein YhaH (DUF805 family)